LSDPLEIQTENAIIRQFLFLHRALVATSRELSDFLQSVEKRAFKRSFYHVRDEDAALDIVQDSMIKLAQHYADKPVDELPMLFQRILSNTTLDWFRRKKTKDSLFSNFSDFEARFLDDSGEFDLLETLSTESDNGLTQSVEEKILADSNFEQIEEEIKKLPARQREAFLLRYWEDLDVAETAAAMGCSEGSVKTHCFRAIQTLSQALIAKGFQP
jgi:RNA polymerase sigma-70 factor (ECF subfamily)